MQEVFELCKKYPILYCFLVATVIVLIMGFFCILYMQFDISLPELRRAKKVYRKLSKKYNSKCIIAISAYGSIEGISLGDGYAIATEEKIIFVNDDFGIPIEISIPYEKIDHFVYMANNNFSFYKRRIARKEIDCTLYLKNDRIHFASSSKTYSSNFNAISFKRVNFYEYLSKFIPTRDMRIEI